MANNQQWNHSLFNCFSGGLMVCLTAYFCPCVQYGKNVQVLGNGEFCQHCMIFACCMPCSCFCAGPKRTEMRNAYHLEEVCINDCVTTCCCMACSLCQIAAEIETRGVPQGGPTGQSMA